MKREEKKRRTPDNEPANMKTEGSINTDPTGSWTGVSTDSPYETPVQDADDL